MSTKEINQAAKDHAKSVLGEEQFVKNKDAIKSIADDFKAGVKWVNKQDKKDPFNLIALKMVIMERHESMSVKYYRSDDCDDLAIMLGKMEVMEEVTRDIDKLIEGEPIAK